MLRANCFGLEQYLDDEARKQEQRYSCDQLCSSVDSIKIELIKHVCGVGMVVDDFVKDDYLMGFC